MKKHRTKKAPGLPPGSLIYTGHHVEVPFAMEILRYNDKELEGKTFTVAELEDLDVSDGYVNWVNVIGLHDPAKIAEVGKKFNIHQLLLEDMLNIAQRPKVQVGDDSVFLTFKMLNIGQEEVDEEQISLYLTGNTVISFQEKHGDVFEPLRTRITQASGRIRSRKADYLLYALLDVVIDTYFHIIESVGERQENVEDMIDENRAENVSREIRGCKKDLNTLRKAIYPLREAVGTIHRGESSLFDDSTIMFLTDAYDHLIQLTEMIETHRELNGDLRDVYLSDLSNRLNEVMKVLTIISTIFIPLGFLAAVYGMNFEYMPELKWPFGYLYFWIIGMAVVIGMLIYFKVRKWL